MKFTRKLMLAAFASGCLVAGAALAETDNPTGEDGAPGVEETVVDDGVVGGDEGVVDGGIVDDGIVGDGGGETGEIYTFGGGDGSELMYASGAGEDFGDGVAGDDFAAVTESMDAADAIGDDIDKAAADRSDKKQP